MLKSRQIEQRIKVLERINNSSSPPKQWKKRSLLSLHSSGDIKWSDNTVKKHEGRYNDTSTSSMKRYYSNVGNTAISSPRGDVELADFSVDKKMEEQQQPKMMQSPRVFGSSPIRKFHYNDTSNSSAIVSLKPRASQPSKKPPPRSISPHAIAGNAKIYISIHTKRIMHRAIRDIGQFPITHANLALCLQNDKEVIESILDDESLSNNNNDEVVLDMLQGQMMSISLSEEDNAATSEHELIRTNKRVGYKSTLGELVTRGNNKCVGSWEDCDALLGEVFLWSRDVGLADLDKRAGGIIRSNDSFDMEDEKKEDVEYGYEQELATFKSVSSLETASGSIRGASADVSLASTPIKSVSPLGNSKEASSEAISLILPPTRSSSKKRRSMSSKLIPKKAKATMKKISQKAKKKMDPSNLSLNSYRKMIENKVGPSKWNQVFRRPHYMTPRPIQEAEARLDDKIQALEQSRTSRTDEILARRQEEEQQRQASERASSLLRPLTEEEESIVQKALYGIGPSTEILASHDADSVQRASMQRLQPGQWVNDEIINYFLKNCLAKRDEKLCAAQPGRKRSHFFNSYFVQTLFDEKNNNPSLRGRYSYKNVKRWSKKVPGKDIFNLRYIFCPINLDNMHWTSAVIFMEEKKIQYYDSLGGTDRVKLEGLLEYVKDEYKAKKGGDMDVSEWKLVGCTSDTPRQLNGELSLLLD